MRRAGNRAADPVRPRHLAIPNKDCLRWRHGRPGLQYHWLPIFILCLYPVASTEAVVGPVNAVPDSPYFVGQCSLYCPIKWPPQPAETAMYPRVYFTSAQLRYGVRTTPFDFNPSEVRAAEVKPTRDLAMDNAARRPIAAMAIIHLQFRQLLHSAHTDALGELYIFDEVQWPTDWKDIFIVNLNLSKLQLVPDVKKIDKVNLKRQFGGLPISLPAPDQIVKTATDGANTVADGAKGAAETVANAGIDLANTVTGAATGLANGAVDALRKQLGIKDYYAVTITSLCQGNVENDQPTDVTCSKPFTADAVQNLVDSIGKLPQPIVDLLPMDKLKQVPKVLSVGGGFFVVMAGMFLLSAVLFVSTPHLRNDDVRRIVSAVNKFILGLLLAFNIAMNGLLGYFSFIITQKINDKGDQIHVTTKANYVLWSLTFVVLVLNFISFGMAFRRSDQVRPGSGGTENGLVGSKSETDT
ncbi:hypothetical protein B0T26DRAFT_681918 [Lasiosphaeria miniovina]|uniref:Uncharacterized protein n=1 Tax=Lasiosphaeria miniovina TaxID=1954250 RepID=A0AA39ZQQ2_9PEZI|nr:uncharacterized protein B0T26DRAFT_681918 [Lasiosphaeria miniovina]KAK0701818.1 hypothetical protein B0T26DRAFT_681918 [Lasiosphaeria miniovina]